MIYTITLNPAIDRLLETDKFLINETNYYQKDVTIVGGKGINVAVLLNNLNTDVVALGLLGNQNLDLFDKTFKEVGLQHHFSTFNGNTRINYKLKDVGLHTETELNGEGIANNNDVKQVLEYLKQNLQANDVVVVSGSVPKMIDEDIYYQIGKIINEIGAIFILDSSKNWIKLALKAHPFLIKPNLQEICQLLNCEFKNDYSIEEIHQLVMQLQQLGARNVLVSMSSQGSLYFSENDEIYHTGIATGKLVSSVGAGDSMVGGFVYGLVNQLSIEETLKYASACGGASAFSQWIGSKSQIEELYQEIIVKKIK